MKVTMNVSVACLALTLLWACSPSQPPATEAPGTQAESAPPVAADFEPCNVVTFASVRAVIGVEPDIASQDNTGVATPNWATCAYLRADGSAGPTFTVNVAQRDTSADASNAHSDIVAGLAGAEALANDPEAAVVWTEGGSRSLQYVKNRWLVRYTVNGASDEQARTRLTATPRWP